MRPVRVLSVLVAVAGLGLAASTPAVAGDVVAPSATATRSPVGDWVTRTDGVRQTITFTKDGKVFGNAGCNQFSGTYTTHGSDMSIGPLAATLMMCEDKVMDVEATFLVRIQAVVGYHATQNVLKLFAPKDLVQFRKRI